jgi:hypothetical protein
MDILHELKQMAEMSICEAARHFGAITSENFGNILRGDGFCNTEHHVFAYIQSLSL